MAAILFHASLPVSCQPSCFMPAFLFHGSLPVSCQPSCFLPAFLFHVCNVSCTMLCYSSIITQKKCHLPFPMQGYPPRALS
ncbi:MAG: hypothetical protein ACOVOA_13890, partial [Allorhizobium sp.]